jgi:predicted AAA+ superfamily ATPase
MSRQSIPAIRNPAARVRSTVALALLVLLVGARGHGQSASINGHPVVLDGQRKIVTWMTPAATAFDRFLD